MKRRRRPTPDDVKGVKALTFYFTSRNVKANSLTIPVQTILQGLEQGKTQSQLARELGTSRSAVSQRIKRLRALGFAKSKFLNKITACDSAPVYDKRNRSRIWKLAHDVKLPFEKEWHPKGLTKRFKSMRGANFKKEASYTVNIGKDGNISLEIYGGLAQGKTPEETNLKTDMEALNIYKWLCLTFPSVKLEEASGGLWASTVNREGELNDLKGAELARIALEQTGSSVVYFGDPPKFKADRSKGYPELQELPDTKKDEQFTILRMDMAEVKNSVNQLVEVNRELASSINKLVQFLTGKPGDKAEPHPPEPEWKPDKHDYR